jgi:hypothetical protein
MGAKAQLRQPPSSLLGQQTHSGSAATTSGQEALRDHSNAVYATHLLIEIYHTAGAVLRLGCLTWIMAD